MRSTFRLGRIAGIQIGVNWSVFVVAGLIAWMLATYVLPELQPGYPVATYWVVGIAVALTFFASLLAHEFGHSLVARRHGVVVDEITLWLLGGVSKLHADSKTAGEEFRMAVAGPLVSLSLAVAFGFVAATAVVVGLPDLVVAGFVWLAATNLILGVFNLLPAFPLDGGRVLRSILWYRSGDRLRATDTAARAGQVCGFLLVGLGLTEFAFGGVGGLWLVFLGWFVMQAARGEASVVAQTRLLAGVTVRDIMTADPVTVSADLPIDELIDRYVLGSRHSAYPVTAGAGAPIGLISLDTIRRVDAAQRASTTVGMAMLPLARVVTIAPDDEVNDVIPIMVQAQARRALVVDRDGRLTGLLSMTDVGHSLDAHGVASTGEPPAGGVARPAPAPASTPWPKAHAERPE
jgi:Zn-dependent protease/CBS domain-containing protein